MLASYNHLIGYLHRWTVCKIGKLHVRIHHILTADGTPFLHNHPFGYLSFLFKGGYTEQVLEGNEIKIYHHAAPALICRNHSTFHRIKSLDGPCKSLFFAWGTGTWKLMRHKDVDVPTTYVCPAREGIYMRTINGKTVYSKFDHGMWFVGADTAENAAYSTQISVHQTIDWWW